MNLGNTLSSCEQVQHLTCTVLQCWQTKKSLMFTCTEPVSSVSRFTAPSLLSCCALVSRTLCTAGNRFVNSSLLSCTRVFRNSMLQREVVCLLSRDVLWVLSADACRLSQYASSRRTLFSASRLRALSNCLPSIVSREDGLSGNVGTGVSSTSCCGVLTEISREPKHTVYDLPAFAFS